MNELTVFPTELAMRQFQQMEALRTGFVDASGHTTFARLRRLCLPYSNLKNKPLGEAHKLLLRKQVLEVARGHFVDGGPLGELSEAALGGVLDQLITELASLPEETDRIVDWMLSRSPRHKLYQLGMLFSIWRATLRQEGFADTLDLNTATLKLLKGNRQKWPPLLRDAKKITFRSIRWLNPFEESCVAALNQKMKVRIESALPPAHAEKAEDRLGQRIRSEIMGSPWAPWAEDLGDALAVDSPDLLQLADADRIAFSRSAGTYGEIEGLARRICWNIQTLEMPPHRIALVVPNLGTVQDIVPHVFSRFQIPYFFRRGRPVLSSPCVKAFFAWLSFPLRPERDTFIDLVRNPAIAFENREATAESLLKLPPRLDPEQAGKPARSGADALKILDERIVAPEDHFNTEALKAAATALEGLGTQQMPLNHLVDLAEELLENATVRPRDSHEQGVWILNPHDAVGLEFDLVLFAGLNEGEFPGIPRQDALLSDKERYALRLHLEERGRCLPRLALPSADLLFEQESVLFLAALGMACNQLVLSCQAVDQEGNERNESEYYRKLWNLAGWCARDQITLSPYDQWRIGQLGDENIFSNHWKAQQTVEREERKPMPGESFLPIVPLPLCRAKDEALQAAVQQQGRRAACDTETVPPASSGLLEKHLVEMLEIEAEREAFLDTPLDDRESSVYCGHLPQLKNKVAEWFEKKETLSPTALESLAQCRYIFLLERVFGLRDPRMADDTPDPMDRGGLIHSILQEIYSAIARGEAGIDAPRYWAVKTSKGWKKRTEGGADALPLAVFALGFEADYLAFAKTVAKRRMEQAVLGHPGVWAAEREKILTMVDNFVRYDVQNCTAENRFPALFEHTFDHMDLQGLVQVRGKIDRIDLLFADTGELKKMRVLDYKGSSRARNKTEEYEDEIRSNLDCQLPIYAMAAQRYFLGESNTEPVNAMTEAGYLFYERDFPKIGKSLKKCLLPMDTPELLDDFLETLAENLRRLKDGDFAVDPLIASYNDYQSVCRTEAVERGREA